MQGTGWEFNLTKTVNKLNKNVDISKKEVTNDIEDYWILQTVQEQHIHTITRINISLFLIIL